MSELSPNEVIGRAMNAGLLNGYKMTDVLNKYGASDVEFKTFRRWVLQDGLLTEYQLDRLLDDGEGLILDGYKLLEEIGSSEIAIVMRAEHLETGETVALKILREEFRDNKLKIAQFVAEGNRGAALKHENIVSIEDVVSKGRVHYYRVEYLEASSLHDLLEKKQRLQPLEALKVMAGVARGLSFAFKRGVTHRDIYKSKILIDVDGTVKLNGFGLAVEEEDINREQIGNDELKDPRTIEYRGLEKATEAARGDKRSDIYFCGCLLYEMMTGKDPLGEPTFGRVMSGIRYRGVVQLRYFDKTLPRPVTMLVDRAMQLNVRERFQTPEELLLELENVIKGLEREGNVEDHALSLAAKKKVTDEEPKSTVLVVAADSSTQTMLRKHLGRLGHRVLVAEQAREALDLLRKDPAIADCLIFSAKDSPKEILKVYNNLDMIPGAKEVPAMLMLGSKQRMLYQKVKTSEHRVLMQAPMKARDFVGQLNKLLPVASVILSRSQQKQSESSSAIGI